MELLSAREELEDASRVEMDDDIDAAAWGSSCSAALWVLEISLLRSDIAKSVRNEREIKKERKKKERKQIKLQKLAINKQTKARDE